ncbi:signal peptidase II [Corynebacterium timonense]|uniref:Lipoprotein signal peptidase n=1 Tax=Corynebacterium timonense TaxID=441500 RepID=A0A1H1MNW1_9CORY|nr:signal peptidase II [Corynebacterium timonense]SDR88448.1 signal peptidase II Aspartic peptidase. MEROPS family A08 [Corynebacterium timonense]
MDIQKERSATRGVKGRRLAVLAGVMAAIAAIDQLIKQIAVTTLEPGEPVNVIGDWFRLVLLFNPGAAFSMGQNSTWLFTTIQLAFVVGALVAAPHVSHRVELAGLALIAGGALGNLIDRLTRPPGFWFGHVIDYISVGGFAVFNFADAAITVGVAVFIIALFVGELDNGR